MGDPESFVSKMIYLQGKAMPEYALTKDDGTPYTLINLSAGVRGKTVTESITVTFVPKQPKTLSEECYRIYGFVAGTLKVWDLVKGNTRNPWVAGLAWEKSPAGTSYGCKAP